MKPVDNSISIFNISNEDFKNVRKTNTDSLPKDSVEISNTAKVYDRIDKFLNLGRPDRLDVSDLNDAEKEEFLKMLANLLKHGIIGYEILEVNGQPEKHFIVNQIGDERIYGAKLYKKDGFYKD
ncbi:MAG: hypothetical protein ACYC4T_03340 [Melioribacteraceae bacterium]